jgi:hypothetical protein
MDGPRVHHSHGGRAHHTTLAAGAPDNVTVLIAEASADSD